MIVPVLMVFVAEGFIYIFTGNGFNRYFLFSPMEDLIAAPISDNKTRWITGIDSFRFVFALIVLFGHYPNPFLASGVHSQGVLKFAPTLFAVMFNGAGAVIGFFIISGFVIHFPNRKKTSINIVSFLLRRILRIGLPLLLVELVGYHYNLQKLIPIWSLYCELLYYLFYPVLFQLKISWRQKFIISFILSLLIVAFFNVNGLLSAIHQRNIHYLGDYWVLGTILTSIIGLPCWLMGVLLAEKIDNLHYDVSYLKLWAYRITVFLTSVVLLILKFHFFIGYTFTFNFFALLIAMWLEKEVVYYRAHPKAWLFDYMGKFSYTLYLCHAMLRFLILLFLPYTLYTYPLFVLLAVLISYLLYFIVELPSHKFAQYVSKKYEASILEKPFLSKKT